jgi:hypothetical protein
MERERRVGEGDLYQRRGICKLPKKAERGVCRGGARREQASKGDRKTSKRGGRKNIEIVSN